LTRAERRWRRNLMSCPPASAMPRPLNCDARYPVAITVYFGGDASIYSLVSSRFANFIESRRIYHSGAVLPHRNLSCGVPRGVRRDGASSRRGFFAMRSKHGYSPAAPECRQLRPSNSPQSAR
jgi:hypothetical protein